MQTRLSLCFSNVLRDSNEKKTHKTKSLHRYFQLNDHTAHVFYM